MTEPRFLLVATDFPAEAGFAQGGGLIVPEGAG